MSSIASEPSIDSPLLESKPEKKLSKREEILVNVGLMVMGLLVAGGIAYGFFLLGSSLVNRFN